MHKSEIAKLREQIETELVSMRLGLCGLAAGIARHQFIEAKMHHVSTFEQQLASHVGREQAILFSCQTYIQVMNEEPTGRTAQGGSACFFSDEKNVH